MFNLPLRDGWAHLLRKIDGCMVKSLKDAAF